MGVVSRKEGRRRYWVVVVRSVGRPGRKGIVVVSGWLDSVGYCVP